MTSLPKTRSFWWGFWSALLLPLVYISYAAMTNRLGPEPAKALVEFLGEVALYILFLVLAVLPLSRLALFSWLTRYRRLLGLYAFFYALLHVLAYGGLLVDWQNFIEDLYKRPYVIAGALGFVILFLLAVTSPKLMLRRLGRRWKPLHRLVYIALICVVIHVWWQSRASIAEPLLYAVISLLLLSFRCRYFRALIKT